MAWLSFESFTDSFAETAVSGGYVVAMAAVCLLQYVVCFMRVTRIRNERDQIRDQMQQVESELNHVRNDQAIVMVENEVLRDFAAEPDLTLAMEDLLKKFVPCSTRGLCAIVSNQDGRNSFRQVRGISVRSQRQFELDDEIAARLFRSKTLTLTGRQFLQSSVVENLTPDDREKIQQLYFIAIEDASGPLGFLLTSSLFPASIPLAQQLDLALRLMDNVAFQIRQRERLEQNQNQLRYTTEMLRLRSVVDQHEGPPIRMIDEFLTQLVEMSDADRAALYLQPNSMAGSPCGIVHCGRELQNGLLQRWTSHERTLSEYPLLDGEHASLGLRELKQIGVDTLIGHALLIPVLNEDKQIGTLCLTKAKPESFDTNQLELIQWAAQYLATTMVRAISFAAVERRAREDGLTSLANRRTFDESMSKLVQSTLNSGSTMSLLLLDLDRFKSVNDTYGHQAGDEVLRMFAGVLRHQVDQIRESDRAIVARYGGEEMAVLLPGVSLRGAGRVAESVRQAVEATPIRCGQESISVTVSIGLAVCPVHGQTVEDLIAAADAALYQAKESGRNRVCSVDISMAGV